MDKFKNRLPADKFRATNAIWNQLRLNDPWSVGYVSSLIESQPFIKKEDWEAFYYKSGEERNKKLATVNFDLAEVLNNSILPLTHPVKVKRFLTEVKNLNYYYGRTPLQLAQKGEILFNHLAKSKWSLTADECAECVRYRVICETWNGIIIREQQAVRHLQKLFPKVEFRKTEGSFDHRYAVDYELFVQGQLICGIQIKPPSYAYQRPYLAKARQANQRKNEAYAAETGKPVLDVLFGRGEVWNKEVVKELKFLIENLK